MHRSMQQRAQADAHAHEAAMNQALGAVAAMDEQIAAELEAAQPAPSATPPA